MGSMIGAAASRWVAEQLAGPDAPVHVEHASSLAVYVRSEAGVIGLLARGAVHVPNGLRTTLPRVPHGPARIGAGRLHIGDLSVHVTRLVDPVVRSGPPPRSDLLEADPVEVRPAELLGRGPGLTPHGDDVLSGYLVGRHAFGTADADLAQQVMQLAPHRTTPLSATLLARAALGEAAPPVHRLVHALRTGERVAAITDSVLAIGDTSGQGLLAGIMAAGTASRAVEVA